jgi:acetate kinase
MFNENSNYKLGEFFHKIPLIDMPSNEVICSGMIDRIGLETNLSYVTENVKLEEV